MASHHRLVTLLLTFLLLVSSSSARLLMISFSLADTQPTINNIALPTDSTVSESEKKAAPGHVMPCHMEATAVGESSTGARVRAETVAGKYKSLFLNMLPKNVPVPPSGPSGRINNDPN